MFEAISVKQTTRPHTFFMKPNWEILQLSEIKYPDFGSEITSAGVYREVCDQFIEYNKSLGLNPRLKVRFKWNHYYYITFASKHDVMAFKLAWL